jgi:hypothetical protein
MNATREPLVGLAERLRDLLAKATPGPWEALVADSDDLLAAMRSDAARFEDRIAGLIFSRADPGAEGHGVSIATSPPCSSPLKSSPAGWRHTKPCCRRLRRCRPAVKYGGDQEPLRACPNAPAPLFPLPIR